MSLHELLDLIFRWVHVIAGIMWIGNSLLFNWLDRNLVKPEGAAPSQMPGLEGEIWLLHSGGFYQVQKTQLAPHQLPPVLHWFKWQNGITWLSGICLLIVVYYFNDAAFLVDPQVAALGPNTAIALSVGLLVLGWAIYDGIWRTLGTRAPSVATVISVLLLGLVTVGVAHTFSGRAAYIQVGVLMGTIMTGNVWMVIVPSQRALVKATRDGLPQDKALGWKAKQRSIHNNYMTFPLLFIMVSNHFPSTWGNRLNWLVLFVLMAAGAGVRHFMNIRFGYPRWAASAASIVVAATIALFLLTAPRAPHLALAARPTTGPVSFAKAQEVVQRRCVACHSAHPTETALFPTAPNGVMFDTPEQIQRLSARIKIRAVDQKTMPFVNRTGMTDDERDLLGRWVDQGARPN